MVCVLYFINDEFFSSKVDLSQKDQKEVAQIQSKFGTVKRKLTNDISWFEVNESDKLYTDDTIFTEEKSEANLVFSDGGSIQIGPLSLVSVSLQKDNPFIDLKKGKLFGQLKKGKKIRIKSSGTVKEIEGEDAKITLDINEKGTSKITILDGKLKIKSGSTSKVVQKNQVINLNRKGEIGKNRTLNY